MKYYIFLFLGFTIILLNWGCEENTSPIIEDKYMMLNVGDIRQFYDSTYSHYYEQKFVGTTYRTDGLEVFIGVWRSSYDNGLSSDTGYYFIRDDYYWETDLDTNQLFLTSLNNPFAEIKQAKIKPNEGDRWEPIENNSATIFTASYENEIQTLCKTFHDVFVFTANESMKYYYANNYGFIAVGYYDGRFSSVNFIRVNGEEIGEYVPLDLEN